MFARNDISRELDRSRRAAKLALAAGALALLLLAACVGGDAFAQGAPPADDDKILLEVQSAIHSERSLARSDIQVESRGGIVTLKGFARTMEDIATAGRIARGVRGVAGVNNSIRIAVRPSRA